MSNSLKTVKPFASWIRRISAATLLASTLGFAASAQAECVSAAPHVSDAWCQAVDCADVYVQGGFCRTDNDAHEAEEPEEATPAPTAPANEPVETETEDEAPEAPAEDNADDQAEDYADDQDEDDAAENAGLCVSAMAHIPDAWCQSHGCHAAYITSGHCEVVTADDADEAE